MNSSNAASLRIRPATCLVLLLAGTLAGGCAQRYALTLSNSDVVYTTTKPKLNERGMYVFKNAQGQEQQINALRVRVIERR